MSTSTIPRISVEPDPRCFDAGIFGLGTQSKKEKKERKYERHASQIGGEIGHINQQRQAAGPDPQVTQQTIHVFAVPEL